MRTPVITLAAALASAALATNAWAADASADTTPGATPETTSRSGCFATNSWRSWTASPDGDALFLRVNLNDVYRVDLTPGSRARKTGGQFLVNQVRGSSWICSHLDLDLAISDDLGFRQPLIATGLRKLTPQEVEAIPRKYRP